ncbi:MAG TPA: helix-turn-helix domain-containing protein [Candidatus Saccharimonadales bacterium]|nr:helix-turn-helix domain-containing protein [Candidatus Saccharimonadales bacterium]
MNKEQPITDDVCTGPKAPCQFDQTFRLVGDFWTLRLISTIGEQELRFGEIDRQLGDCNPVTLTSRLKKLEEAAVVERHVETRDKQSVTYTLTEKGKDILPIISSLRAFTEKYAD